MLSNNLEETHTLAKDFVEKLGLSIAATVVGLHGDLGSGKTSFTQGVAKALGIEDTIQSPTYVIMKSYDIPDGVFRKLVHIDAYRLENGEELSRLRFGELLSIPENLILVEWPEKVESALPEDYIRIDFEHVDETIREIKIRNSKFETNQNNE